MNKKLWYLLIPIIILSVIVVIKLKDKDETLLYELDEEEQVLEVVKPEVDRFIINLKLAYEGRMDYRKEIIGENAEQYIGHPAIIGYLVGGLVISYDDNDVILYTNGHFDEDDKVIAGDVVMISKAEAYGIKTGMSMDEVENILGEADHIIDFSLEPVESELFDTNTCAYYETGDYEVIIVFDRWTKDVINIYLSGNKLNQGFPTAKVLDVDFLNLTDEELRIYNTFKEDYNEEVLKGLEPLSIMKLYLQAGFEKDYETEWELYTKEKNQLGWDKEYHMSIQDKDRKSDFSVFENPINIRVDIDSDYAVVSWEDKYLEEYDGDGKPYKFGFSLVKSKDGIWKVGFLPMQ